MKKLALLLLFGCAACTSDAQHSQTGKSSSAGAAVTAPVVKTSGSTVADIKRLIGTPACSDNAQCRTVPVGALACGGPQEYLAWSTTRTNERELLALSERSKTERQAQIKSTGEMSICLHQPDPGAVCVAGTCQLGSASTAS